MLTKGWGGGGNLIVSRGKNTTNYGFQGDTLSLLGAFPSKNFTIISCPGGINFYFIKYLIMSWGEHNQFNDCPGGSLPFNYMSRGKIFLAGHP